MLNRIILIGRLTRDPELRYTPANNVPCATFTLAVDRPYANQKGEREADFIRIATWRKLAEICANNLTKGRLVAVDGRLQIRSYEGQDSQRRYITEVVAETVRFLDKAQNKAQGKEQTDGIDINFDFGDFDDISDGDGVPF